MQRKGALVVAAAVAATSLSAAVVAGAFTGGGSPSRAQIQVPERAELPTAPISSSTEAEAPLADPIVITEYVDLPATPELTERSEGPSTSILEATRSDDSMETAAPTSVSSSTTTTQYEKSDAHDEHEDEFDHEDDQEDEDEEEDRVEREDEQDISARRRGVPERPTVERDDD